MTVLATREDILAQIARALASISGVATFARNRGLLETDDAPAIVLLDGREDIVTSVVPQKTVRMPPAIMRLQPQIFVILKQRDDATNTTLNGHPDPVGPEMSYWRDAVIDALLSDQTLLGMLTTTGQIVFRGMETDMQTGGTIQGQIRLLMDFHYVWAPPIS